MRREIEPQQLTGIGSNLTFVLGTLDLAIRSLIAVVLGVTLLAALDLAIGSLPTVALSFTLND